MNPKGPSTNVAYEQDPNAATNEPLQGSSIYAATYTTLEASGPVSNSTRHLATDSGHLQWHQVEV